MGEQDRHQEVEEEQDRRQAVEEEQDRHQGVEGLRTRHFELILKLIKQQRWECLSSSNLSISASFHRAVCQANYSCVDSSRDIAAVPPNAGR